MADSQDCSQENACGHPYGIGCATYSWRERYAADDWLADGSMAGRACYVLFVAALAVLIAKIWFNGKILVMIVTRLCPVRLRAIGKLGRRPSEDGYTVSIVQNPTTSLADDVAATRRAIAEQDGPVVLVGHSYGGGVVSEAGTDEKVKAVVYIAAFRRIRAGPFQR